jgi:hypothetical protein
MTDGKDFWFDTKEMCQRGIATHVEVNGLVIPAKQYLKLLKKAKKTAKKLYPDEKLKIGSLREALIYNIDALSPVSKAKQESFAEIQSQIIELINNYDHDDA